MTFRHFFLSSVLFLRSSIVSPELSFMLSSQYPILLSLSAFPSIATGILGAHWHMLYSAVTRDDSMCCTVSCHLNSIICKSWLMAKEIMRKIKTTSLKFSIKTTSLKFSKCLGRKKIWPRKANSTEKRKWPYPKEKLRSILRVHATLVLTRCEPLMIYFLVIYFLWF